jgi:hypothetical protein
LSSPSSDVKIKYTKGIKKVEFANCDIFTDCGHGINLCPNIELAKKWGKKVVLVKVNIGDIVCIPVNEDTKFRVKKCQVIKEVKQ